MFTKIIIFLMSISVAILSFQIIEQNETIDELYRIVESHNETLILQHTMMKGLAQQSGKAIDMLEVMQGKMIWEMEW
jgi:hypothetical protein